jgi:hypothetical protein
MISQHLCRLRDYEKFRVGERRAAPDREVVRPGYNPLVFRNDESAYRHLLLLEGPDSLIQAHLHKKLILHFFTIPAVGRKIK